RLPISTLFPYTTLFRSYFPLVLSAILVALGLGLCVQALRNKIHMASMGTVPWRGVVILSLATIVFATFVEELGLLVGVFLTTFIDRKSTRLNSSHVKIS